MARIDRAIEFNKFDTYAQICKWHRNAPDKHLRKVTYYNGASYVRIWFSRIFYDIVTVEHWISESNRLEVWDKKHYDNLQSCVLQIMFDKHLKNIVSK